MAGEDGKDAAILKELREISDKHSAYKNTREETARTSPSASNEREIANREDINTNEAHKFLSATGENRDLNQYWYSKNTIEILCNVTREGLSISNGNRVAFLSTPSLFFSLSPKEREHCVLFDFDDTWESCSEYHFYDYNDPTNIKDDCHGAFDLIVIDPPFITQSVWKKYATTAKLLMRGDGTHIIGTTVEENSILMRELFDCKPAVFRPSIPNLVYQYSVFTNFSSSALGETNLELQEGMDVD